MPTRISPLDPQVFRQPVDGILGAIGDTPLVALRRLLARDDIHVWGKLEMANPGGSAKDRSAAAMLDQALAQGVVGSETTVIESSSGNLGIGLAQVCRYHGLRLIVVVDVANERQERPDDAGAWSRRTCREPSRSRER